MKRIVDIDDVMLKHPDRFACDVLATAIEESIPYDKVIDEVTELLENEWGYEGMRDDVSKIMKGGAE